VPGRSPPSQGENAVNPAHILVGAHVSQRCEVGDQPHIPEDVAILCTRDGVKVETLSEHQMNEMGWYKFDTNKVN